MGSVSINLRGSLPQIKNELERGKKTHGQKTFIEDNNSARVHDVKVDAGINSDYAMSQYKGKGAKSAG